MSNHVLGAQLYSVRQSVQTIEGVRETFEKVRKIGYTAVQISGFGPIDPRQITRAVRDSGITVAATHVGWERFLNDLDAVIGEHKDWGCTHAAIGGLPQEYFSGLDGLKRFLDELPPVAEKLAAHGLDFSYHNHHHELARYGQKTWLEMLYAQADPRHLKAEIDTHWIQRGGGDPAAWIRRYPGRQPLLHLKDMSITTEREVRYAEIGEGNLNWPAILAAAAEVKVRWYFVEQDECYGRDPFESLAISYRNLKAMGLS